MSLSDWDGIKTQTAFKHAWRDCNLLCGVTDFDGTVISPRQCYGCAHPFSIGEQYVYIPTTDPNSEEDPVTGDTVIICSTCISYIARLLEKEKVQFQEENKARP